MAERTPREQASSAGDTVWPLRLGAATCLVGAMAAISQATPHRFEVAFAAIIFWVPVCLSILVSCALVPKISRAIRIGWPTKIALAGIIPPAIVALPLTLFPGLLPNAITFYFRPTFLLLPTFGVLLIGGTSRFRWALALFAIGLAGVLVSVDVAQRIASGYHTYSRLSVLVASFSFPAKFPIVAGLTGFFALGTAARRVGLSPRWLKAAHLRWSLAVALLVFASPPLRLSPSFRLYPLCRFLLGLVLFRERTASHAIEAAFLIVCYCGAVAFSVTLAVALNRRTFAKNHPLSATAACMFSSAALLGLASLAVEILRDPTNRSGWPGPIFLLVLGSILGGAALGGINVARPARVVVTNGFLALLVAALHLRLWASATGRPELTADDAQFAWKVPAVGSMLVLASFFAAWARAQGWPAHGTRRTALALAVLGAATWVQPFTLPRTLTMAEISGVDAAKLTSNGDIVLQVILKNHPLGGAPIAAVALKRHGQGALRFLSRRPLPHNLSYSRDLSISPDGERVAVPETATELASRAGTWYWMVDRSVDSGRGVRLFSVGWNAQGGGGGFGTVLGPETSSAAVFGDEVRGRLLGGRWFRLTLPHDSSRPRLWFCAGELQVFAVRCGPFGTLDSWRSCLFSVDLHSGKTERFMLPIAGNAALESISGTGRDFVVRAFSGANAATQGFYWLDSSRGLHKLAEPPPARNLVNPWWSRQPPQVLWSASGPQLLPSALNAFGEVRFVDGLLLAIGRARGGSFESGADLWILDNSFQPTRKVASGVFQLQWLDDSVVYRQLFATMLGTGSRWTRYWPATDRKEVVFEKLPPLPS
jgi:hypothetical protein